MAKRNKQPKAKAQDSTEILDDVLPVFLSGDFKRARGSLQIKIEDPAISESQRDEAKRLYSATRIEPGALRVGLACIAFFVVVLLVTFLTQP